MTNLLYALPAIPIIARLLVGVRYSGYMRDALSEEALDRADHRSLIVAICGFSFAGLLALVALPGDLTERQLPIWFILCSFLALFAALNLQGYKALRWHDLVGDALLESASLGLIASVGAFISRSNLPLEYRLACAALAGSVWASDFVIRLWLTISNLREKEIKDGLTLR